MPIRYPLEKFSDCARKLHLKSCDLCDVTRCGLLDSLDPAAAVVRSVVSCLLSSKGNYLTYRVSSGKIYKNIVNLTAHVNDVLLQDGEKLFGKLKVLM